MTEQRKQEIEAKARAYIEDALGPNSTVPQEQVDKAVRRVSQLTERYAKADQVVARLHHEREMTA